jgi:hypothetical protein
LACQYQAFFLVYSRPAPLLDLDTAKLLVEIEFDLPTIHVVRTHARDAQIRPHRTTWARAILLPNAFLRAHSLHALYP